MASWALTSTVLVYTLLTSPKVSRALTMTDSRRRGQVWSPGVKWIWFFPYRELKVDRIEIAA